MYATWLEKQIRYNPEDGSTIAEWKDIPYEVHFGEWYTVEDYYCDRLYEYTFDITKTPDGYIFDAPYAGVRYIVSAVDIEPCKYYMVYAPEFGIYEVVVAVTNSEEAADVGVYLSEISKHQYASVYMVDDDVAVESHAIVSANEFCRMVDWRTDI